MLHRPRSPFSRLLILSIALASAFMAAAAAVGGCGERQAVPAAQAREPVDVIATTYAMADIVRAVGGKHVNVEWWVESGGSLAELKENPERRQQLSNAELVVTRGQVDPWTLAGAGNNFQDRRVLRIDTLLAARAHDPSHYIWLDPAVARELAEELVARLGAIDPAHAADFRANADEFQREIDAMTGPVETNIARAGGGPFVTLDRGFYPLARRFGLLDVRIPRVNLSDPTPFNVKQLREATQKEAGGAIFGSTETPAALLRDWESRLGIPVLALDPLGTSGGAGRSTYLDMLRYNLAQLEKGVALSKPRERVAPGPLGAVTPEAPRYADLPAGATDPSTQPAETQPASSTPRVAPQSRPSLAPLRLKIPLPSTQPDGAPVQSPLLPPFKPAPAAGGR